jgi:hypothetical protein
MKFKSNLNLLSYVFVKNYLFSNLIFFWQLFMYTLPWKHYLIATHALSPSVLFLCFVATHPSSFFMPYLSSHTYTHSFFPFLPYLPYHTLTKFPLFFPHLFFFFYHVITHTRSLSPIVGGWVMGHNGPKLVPTSMLGKYIDVPMLGECNQQNPNTQIGTSPYIKKPTNV